MDYHLLSDFRRDHQEAMNDLLTKLVATLMAGNLVTLKEVAQDGMRVRASAGSGSVRRKSRLEECLEAAQEQVERLVQELIPRPRGQPPGADSAGTGGPGAAGTGGVCLGQLPEVQAGKERQAKHAGKARQAKLREARVSTTDPEARVMKMAEGSFRRRTTSSWLPTWMGAP